MIFSKLKGLGDRVMQIDTAILMYFYVTVVSLNHGNHKYSKIFSDFTFRL